ncbi:hypothetical protein [Kitasatospora sp. NPDC096204]|uniref:hypothetical protein n=1 Tax=Kitasatospora sp. NPDC096204 TaxID=3364094 RepID=UPI0037F3F110
MLTDESRTTTRLLPHTAAGRTVCVSRFAPEVLPDTGRVVLDTAREPYDTDRVRLSLTPAEARWPAGNDTAKATAS